MTEAAVADLALTDVETSRLRDLEQTIERGLGTFVEVGQALMEIRDGRLYRETHRAFEDYCQQRWQMRREVADRFVRDAKVVAAVNPIGLPSPANEAQARELAPLLDEPETLREVWAETQARAEATGQPITAALVAEVRDEVRPPNVVTLLMSSESNEWYTPAVYVDAARAVLGGIDLDPASCDEANAVVAAAEFFTAEHDGLKQPWTGRVWLNPPYGRMAGDFAQRLVREHETGAVTAAVLLVNAHCTDTSWFQLLWDYTLCFTNHRIDFRKPGGDTANQSTHGSVFVYLGPDVKGFKHEFGQFGAVVRRS